MGNCFGKEESQYEGTEEMGKVQSKSTTKSRSPSSKHPTKSDFASVGFGSTSSAGGGTGPQDIFSSQLTPDQAKRIKLDPSQIEFGFKKHFHDEYEVTKLLGKGAFASAYQVSPRENSPYFGRCDLAVKVISKASLKNVQDARWLKQEIDIMRRVGGSINMVHVYECYESKNHVYLLMELCSGGNLYEKIMKGDPYTEKMASVLMGDILRVAEQCHSKGIIHRDIKPENFLFANKLMGAPLKMTDFGLADYCTPTTKLKEISGTPYYIAPEVIRMNYGQKADVWSCGILLYVLLTGKSPFHRDDDRKHSYKVVFRRILDESVDFTSDPWPNISAGAKDLCKKLLQKNPQKRITAKEGLQHTWITQNNDSGTDGKSDNQQNSARKDAIVQRLQLFGTYNKLKQVALYRIAKELASPEVAEVKQMWDKMNIGDVNLMGTIRLLDGLELEGFTVGENEGSDLLKAVDVEGKGKIGFEDYAAAIVDWREIAKDKKYYHLCRQVFEEFDTNKDGYITSRELAEELPGTFTEKELKSMIAEADTKGHKKIDFKDFVYFIQEKLGSADMFDKRLSSRYRNSFPRRTNSFLRKMNLPGAAAVSSSEASNSNKSALALETKEEENKAMEEGDDFNKSIGRKSQVINDVPEFKEF